MPSTARPLVTTTTAPLLPFEPPANDVRPDPARAVNILETFDPLWPGRKPLWVCTIRVGHGPGRMLHMIGRKRRSAALLAAWKWCRRRGWDLVGIRRGEQAR